jgi:spore germination protein PA
MPSIVGNIKIVSVSSSSIVHIGDSVALAPVSTNKSYAGSGSFNNGDLPKINNVVSSTNTNDQDLFDSNAAVLP